MRPLFLSQVANRCLSRWVIVALVGVAAVGIMSTAVPSALAMGSSANGIGSSRAIAMAASVSQGTPPPPVNERPGEAVLNPIGIGLAVLFLSLMVTLFRWMFRVPPQLPYSVIKARQSVSSLQRILVPTAHTMASERAVELACRLGAAQKAEIVLTYVVEVPFTLSLNTPMPAVESRGQEALRTAQFIVEQHGLPVRTRLIPDRYAWSGVLRVAREEMVDAIVMSIASRRPGTAEGVGHTIQEVLRRAECEVIVDKMSRRS